MGSHGGAGYSSSGGPGNAFESALKSLVKDYPLNDGNSFGTKGSSSRIQVLAVDDPQSVARLFWEKLSSSGNITEDSNGALIAEFKDLTRVIYREESSTPGVPVVKIVLGKPMAGFKSTQNIHFVKKGSKN